MKARFSPRSRLWLVATALLAVLIVVDYVRLWPRVNNKDFRVFVEAGEALGRGKDIFADIEPFKALLESGKFDMKDPDVRWPYAYPPLGAILALPLLWFSRGDEDLLMAAGSFMTPHLFPYHFYLLMPALGRMKTGWMLLTWLLSWSPLLANWLGNIGWHAGNLFALVLWLGIYFSMPKEKRITLRRRAPAQAQPDPA